MTLEARTLCKDGCNIHYWITSGKPSSWIIFLHGAGADHNMFEDQLNAVKLQDQYGVLLWDARGHGLSRPMEKGFSISLLVDDILSIMDREGICKATFIGQSMGGNIAQEVVFYHSDRVESLILIDCTCNTMKLTILERLTIRMTPFLLAIYPWSALVKQSAAASSTQLHVQTYLIDCFQNVGKKDFRKILLETTACFHYEKNDQITVPFLLICGEDDHTGNIRKIAPIWASGEPNCEFHWVKDAGHCANQDNPEAVNKLLVSFIQRIRLMKSK
ncbi:alpha/beta hydrolase [Neobacillus mesonae]|nr:alpha/beta hydrolase [Neobacillus mesonae]